MFEAICKRAFKVVFFSCNPKTWQNNLGPQEELCGTMSKWCCGTNSAAKWWRPPDTITSWDQTLTHFFPPPWSVSLNMAIAALQINSRSMQRIPAPSNWFHVYSFASKRQSVTGEQLDSKKRHNCFWIRGGNYCLPVCFCYKTNLEWLLKVQNRADLIKKKKQFGSVKNATHHNEEKTAVEMHTDWWRNVSSSK